MGRRWRKRTYQKEVVSQEEAARRKERAIRANAEIAGFQMPRAQAEVVRNQELIRHFVLSRGASADSAAALREQLVLKRDDAARRAAEEQLLARQRIFEARREIEKVTEVDKQSRGALRPLFFDYTPSPSALARIARQGEIIAEAEAALRRSCFKPRVDP